MSEVKDTKAGNIKVSIEPDEPKNFSTSLTQIQDKANNLSRMSEQGIVCDPPGSDAGSWSAGEHSVHRLRAWLGSWGSSGQS